MQVTLDLPSNLASELANDAEHLPRILELGVRAWRAADRPIYDGVAEVLAILARLPSADEILALRPSTALQTRIESLLAKNRDAGFSSAEEREWQGYEYLEHLVRYAKSAAFAKLAATA